MVDTQVGELTHRKKIAALRLQGALQGVLKRLSRNERVAESEFDQLYNELRQAFGSPGWLPMSSDRLTKYGSEVNNPELLPPIPMRRVARQLLSDHDTEQKFELYHHQLMCVDRGALVDFLYTIRAQYLEAW